MLTSQKGEGLELSQVQIQGFNPNPAILNDIEDPLVKGWVSVVNSYWTLLIRYVTRRLALFTTYKHRRNQC
jgi:alpha,alpha-trehalase